VGVAIWLSFYVARNIVRFSPMMALMSLSIVIGIVVFADSRYAILIILTGIFAFDWLASSVGVIPRQFSWVPEVTLMILSVKLVLSRMLTRKKLLKTPIDLTFLMVIVVGVIATIVHSAHPIVAVVGFRNYLKYMVMFYLIVNLGLDEKALKQIIKWFIVFMAAQIPISIIQSFFWGADFSGGTIGPGLLGQLSLTIISTMIGFAIYKGLKLRYVFFCLSLIFVWVTSSALAPFFLLPPIVLFLLRRHFPRRYLPVVVLGCIVVMIPIYYAVLQIFPVVGGTDMGYYLLSPGNVYRGQLGQQSSGVLNRFSGIAYAHNMIAEDPIKVLVGVGPGNASPSFFSHYSGQFFGIKTSYTAQLARVILEFGYLGLFFFLMMIFRIFKMNSKFMSGVDDNYWKAISFGFDGTIMAYVLGISYFPVWNDDLVPFTFWFFAAAIYSVGMRRRILKRPQRRRI
jgi:hypothetical protein